VFIYVWGARVEHRHADLHSNSVLACRLRSTCMRFELSAALPSYHLRSLTQVSSNGSSCFMH
jgi:hypothetical protein